MNNIAMVALNLARMGTPIEDVNFVISEFIDLYSKGAPTRSVGKVKSSPKREEEDDTPPANCNQKTRQVAHIVNRRADRGLQTSTELLRCGYGLTAVDANNAHISELITKVGRGLYSGI